MTVDNTYLYCGTHWDENGHWSYELIGTDGAIQLREGTTTRLAFRITDPARYCLGYYRFDGELGQRLACPDRAQVPSGKQCSRCRFREGFTTIHGHRGPITGLPEQIRKYMAQPHLLYIAYFGAGRCKVGTAALSRRNSRLFEQGAILARIIAGSPDGLHVRDLERAVSATGFKQSLTSAAKTSVLTKPLEPWANLESDLEAAAADAVTALPAEVTHTGETWAGGEWFYNTLLKHSVLEDPTDWTIPGQFVLDGVDALGHTIACRDTADSQNLLLVNDSQFIGRRIEVDDTIVAEAAAAQTSLF